MFDEGRPGGQYQKEPSGNVAVINFGEYLKHLVREIIQQSGQVITYSIESDDIYLNVNTAIVCGLIADKLITNALKHAFPGDKEGSIYVKFKQKYGHRALLTIQDTGIGFPKDVDFTNPTTYGLKFINNCVKRLNGEIQLERSQWTTVTIEFPIEGSEPI